LDFEARAAVLRLLADNGLPTDGLSDHVDTGVVARLGDRVVACAALEIYPDGALLRSVAVEKALRGSGLGHQIVRGALDLAREHGTTTVYLLTTTAEGFFARFGFRRIARADVPPAVQTSVEFTLACPSTAAVMVRDLAATAVQSPAAPQ
jgi:amino-acid N-acetyltransferase